MQTKAISFIEIFKNSIQSIEIPIIQRDYAQGRETSDIKRIRESFLDVLYKALVEDSDPVKLDFVYGDIANDKLIPLDGQQRLTTLFLLHWYIAKHEQIAAEEYRFLERFTYKTRFSSTHFGESLVECFPDFDSDKLSDWITDQNWFMSSWEKDPTVKSMLVVLDAIHERFRTTSNLWQKLIDTVDTPISFYFLPLSHMGLTDNLYIKMNSRGKPLTDFEHFKAEFEKIIKTVSETLHKAFAHKIDIDWSDMLWKYRGDDDIVDDEFMRYFRFVTEITCYRTGENLVENDFDLADKVYGPSNPNAENNLEFLFDAFDCWKDLPNVDDFFNGVFSKKQFEPNKVVLYVNDVNLFKQCCTLYSSLMEERHKFSLVDILILYAVLLYLLNKEKVSPDEFRERVRIVRTSHLIRPMKYVGRECEHCLRMFIT